MIYTILSVFNILIAAAMIVLILIQRGSGADAGASFGGGGSGTVFGARGSATFLSRATGVLAALFFIVSLTMGMMLEHQAKQTPEQGLGVMAGLAQPAAAGSAATVVPPAVVPPGSAGANAAPADVPQPAAADRPTSSGSDVPAPQPAESGSAG